MSKQKPAPLPADTVIGGYRVVRRISAGGFGVVYLAVDKEGQQVAIKEYLPASLAERAPGELIPRVKPEKQPLYRLGLKSFFEEGRSLAKALGPNWLVLMRRHGATVAGRNLIELVFRTIYSTRNAELQLMCKAQGHALSPLTPGEARMAMERNLEPRPQARAWEYWSKRLRKAGEYPEGAPKSSAKPRSKPAATRGGKKVAARKKR